MDFKKGDKVKIIYPQVPAFHNTTGTIIKYMCGDYKIKHDHKILWGKGYHTSWWPKYCLKKIQYQLFFNFME